MEDIQKELTDFELLKVIGKGGFGKVYLVKKIDTGDIYAMKSIRKDRILEQDNVENITNEKQILLGIEHPFIVGMKFIINTTEHVFFVMDFIRGGELWQILFDKGRLPE